MSKLAPAAQGGPAVLGISNEFQILHEAHLLPGALTCNADLRFITRDVRLQVENEQTPWTQAYRCGLEEIVVPLKSGEEAHAPDRARSPSWRPPARCAEIRRRQSNGSARCAPY